MRRFRSSVDPSVDRDTWRSAIVRADAGTRTPDPFIMSKSGCPGLSPDAPCWGLGVPSPAADAHLVFPESSQVTFPSGRNPSLDRQRCPNDRVRIYGIFALRRGGGPT